MGRKQSTSAADNLFSLGGWGRKKVRGKKACREGEGGNLIGGGGGLQEEGRRRVRARIS